MENSAVSDGLFHALREPDSAARSRAIWALVEIGAPALPGLLDLLSDLSTNTRTAATEALIWLGRACGELPAEATPLLVNGLRSTDLMLRANSAAALQWTSDRRAVAGLIRVLRDPYYAVRMYAMHALGKLRDPQALPHLIPLLCDPDPHVAKDAKFVLARFGQDAWRFVQAALLEQNAEYRLRGVHGLHALIVEQDEDRVLKEYCFGVLCSTLHDPAPTVRGLAAEYLESLGDPRAIPQLVSSLGHRPPGYPRLILGDPRERALASFGGEALPALQMMLASDQSACRVSAVRVLAQINDEAVQPLLLDALHDPDLGVVVMAIRALEVQHPESIAALADLLRHYDGTVRIEATKALQAVGGNEASKALVAAARDADLALRHAAVVSLGLLGDPQAVPVLVEALHDTRGDFPRPQLIARPHGAAETPLYGPICDAAADALTRIGTREALTAVEKWQLRRYFPLAGMD